MSFCDQSQRDADLTKGGKEEKRREISRLTTSIGSQILDLSPPGGTKNYRRNFLIIDFLFCCVRVDVGVVGVGVGVGVDVAFLQKLSEVKNEALIPRFEFCKRTN